MLFESISHRRDYIYKYMKEKSELPDFEFIYTVSKT